MLAYEQLSGRNHIFNLSIAKFAQDLDHTVCFTDDFLKDRKNELYTKLFVNASPTKSRWLLWPQNDLLFIWLPEKTLIRDIRISYPIFKPNTSKNTL